MISVTTFISIAVIIFLFVVLYRNTKKAVGWRECIEIYAGKGKFEEFSRWAFGPKYDSILIEDVPKWWNMIHGDKLILESNRRITDDIPKMVALWKSEVEKISSNP